MKNKIISGDSLSVLKTIKNNIFDLVITSPPYFQQRDYGNGDSGIGNEKTEEEYLENLTNIFRETVFSDVININTVISMLKEHFESRLSSRLPVIAIYSVYQQLFKTVKRFENKVLRPLNVHTSSDKHGYGDVEIWNVNNTPFEMVEIKHHIPIDRNLVFDVVKKSENTAIERYYILTTYEGCFVSPDEEEYINKFILKIKKDRNLEIIANGIIYSLKYYLRFIEDYHDFLKTYTNELIRDAENSTEVKDFHIKIWQEILKKYSKI